MASADKSIREMIAALKKERLVLDKLRRMEPFASTDFDEVYFSSFSDEASAAEYFRGPADDTDGGASVDLASIKSGSSSTYRAETRMELMDALWRAVARAMTRPISKAKIDYMEHYIFSLRCWDDPRLFQELQDLAMVKSEEMIDTCHEYRDKIAKSPQVLILYSTAGPGDLPQNSKKM